MDELTRKFVFSLVFLTVCVVLAMCLVFLSRCLFRIVFTDFPFFIIQSCCSSS